MRAHLALSHTIASALSLRCIFIGCYFFPKIYFVKLIRNLEDNQVLLGEKFSNSNSLKAGYTSIAILTRMK
jgi:hypothetical protein